MAKAEWVSANEAAEIVSANNGRTVIPQYIRDLAQRRKIQYKPLDGRTNVYLRSDVEKIKVRTHKAVDRTKKAELPSVSEESTSATPTVQGGTGEHSGEDEKSEPDAA